MSMVIHPATEQQFNRMVAAPSHAIMLVGPAGSGKRALAETLAAKILGIDDFADYAYGLRVAPVEGKAIGIESVRELEKFLKLKVPGTAGINRVVLIENLRIRNVFHTQYRFPIPTICFHSSVDLLSEPKLVAV